jgi:DNA polymerase III gamma/tau subunit
LNGNIGIDSIRKIQKFLSTKSGESSYRSVVIDGAEYMNVEAANSFLKISEDTPAGAIIILTAVNKSAIRNTILSRCRYYRFVPLSNEDKRAVLERHNRGSKIDIEAPRKPHMDTLEKYYNKMVSIENDLFALTKVTNEIVEHGQAAHFLDFMIGALTEQIPKLNNENMYEVREVEGLLKRLSFLKTALISHHVSVDTIMADFLLNNYSKIIHYTKERL